WSSDAIAELIGEVKANVRNVDLVFIFFTAEHRENADTIAERVWLELDPQAVIGCSAEGVIGGDLEIERAPGISLLSRFFPSLRIHPFHIGADDWRRMIAEPHALLERIGCDASTRAIIGLGDPFTTPLAQLMQALDEAAPKAPLIGGMASSARQPGRNSLI